jgi:hypothetical protein
MLWSKETIWQSTKKYVNEVNELNKIAADYLPRFSTCDVYRHYVTQNKTYTATVSTIELYRGE